MQHFKGPFSLEVGIDGKLQMPVLVTHGGAADVGTQLKEKSLTLGEGFTESLWTSSVYVFAQKSSG